MGGGGVKVEIKAISAQPTEVGVGLSWAELGKKLNSQKFSKKILADKNFNISANFQDIDPIFFSR